MSGSGAPELSLTTSTNRRVAIVASSWHDEVMEGLLAGANRVCGDAGAQVTTYRVPGSFELPVAAAAAARAGFDAVIALGVIIRGGTPHFEYVCQAATAGLGRVALDTGVPVGFGVLTCDDDAQARDRAGLAGSREDKGAEAAGAALAMVDILAGIKAPAAPVTTGFGAGR